MTNQESNLASSAASSPANPFDLSGKVAVLVAAGGGIGQAVAKSFAAAGAKLMLADVNEESLAALSRAEWMPPGAAEYCVVDVRNSASVDALFARAVEKFSRIDIVVNLAFANALKPVVDSTDEDIDLTLDVCLTSGFRIARAAGRILIAQGTGGSVIHFSSISAYVALARGNSAYAAAKAGVNALIRETAVEWAPYGIRVNGIAPCQTRTPGLQKLLDSSPPELAQRMAARIPLGRIAEPSDMADPCVFLASEAARMITGVILPVDGGFLAI